MNGATSQKTTFFIHISILSCTFLFGLYSVFLRENRRICWRGYKIVILQVGHKGGSMTYCQQVSSRQFEHQRLTGSQLALSELLEQILSDCKMGPKEKRKRLEMVSGALSYSLLECSF
jgi:hypothetical protein